MTTCWCGNADFLPFSSEYGECKVCGTLASLGGMDPEQLQVRDDETDFYGKQYWLNHQNIDLGFPDIYRRARNDLTERNLHWLKTLLKYCLPPAKVLELGCSHGSFVALLRQAGYDASGVELSPWVVEFGQQTFGVPISVGPVEAIDIAPGSLDVIALMDVLEHLPEPVATMAHCLALLKPDGLLLIQTPQFKEGTNYTDLMKNQAPFLQMLIPDEHIYLFSECSVTRLFQQLGAEYIEFEPAIFGQYDMFFVVSRAPLVPQTFAQTEAAILATPTGRLALALLDLRERELDLTRQLQESESDRAARGGQIETLTAMLKEAEADRAARGGQIETLTAMLQEAEADRAARGGQIETLTAMLQEAEADRAAQWGQTVSLSAKLKELEADRVARDAQVASLLADLRALFARPVFRGLTRVSGWPEVRKLREQMAKPNA